MLNESRKNRMKKIIIAVSLIFVAGIIYPQQKNHKWIPVEIKNAWARPGSKEASSAIYFSVINKNGKADTLLNVKSRIAEKTELHESFRKSNDRIGMRQVKFVPVPANSKTEFEPGGSHVMLVNLFKDLNSGSSIEATLNFKYSGKIKIKPVVEDK